MYKLIEKKNGEKGRSFPLKGVVHEIGRASSCDIDLLDNMKASRIHARLEKDSDGWWIVDLNSTNGTFVNKEMIKSKKLAVGDEITIGDSVLIFRCEDDRRPNDMSTEFSQPRLNIRTQDDNEIRKWRKRLIASILALLMFSVAVWVLYSVYINMMNKIHRTAVIINNNTQKIDLLHGDIETAKKINLNLELMRNNLPAIIDFLTKVQDNPRIFNEIKKESPDVTLIAIKNGLDNAIELEQQVNSYLKIMQQIIDATESFKRTQDRRTYKSLVREYAFAINEMERLNDLFSSYTEKLSQLNALMISFDKASSKFVPSLSRNTGIILDSSNKIQDELLRLINNMKTEKAFLLDVKG